MGFRFQRRIIHAPGIRLNLSKRGLGLSVGPRGASLSVGPSGVHRHAGIPGTGLAYRQKLNNRSRYGVVRSGAAGGGASRRSMTNPCPGPSNWPRRNCRSSFRTPSNVPRKLNSPKRSQTLTDLRNNIRSSSGPMREEVDLVPRVPQKATAIDLAEVSCSHHQEAETRIPDAGTTRY
ncbi:DUF4236 domain-containing protein [Halomonas tibetensis]|uniref:DUF4236 domain-containing protein n=1 Tax=Halomonas tibetensis TaxID=2259590 RepID=A0ABV7BAG7_9GAMM